MKNLSFFCRITVALLFFLLFNATNLRAQANFNKGINLNVKTRGKLLSPNKMVVIVEVRIPEGWKLKVEKGYESMWEQEEDSIDLALTFLKNSNYQLVEHLKAARRPIEPGYYDKDVTFVQTLRIKDKKEPFLLDAKLKLFLMQESKINFVELTAKCLLRVDVENRVSRTLRVGWGDVERAVVYLTN
jgi:hypothetical protein